MGKRTQNQLKAMVILDSTNVGLRAYVASLTTTSIYFRLLSFDTFGAWVESLAPAGLAFAVPFEVADVPDTPRERSLLSSLLPDVEDERMVVGLLADDGDLVPGVRSEALRDEPEGPGLTAAERPG